jgi:RNA polymerase sigma factor (sigma-70 family)
VIEQPEATAPEAAVADPTVSVDDRSALLGALQQLPQRQRAAVVLRYWEDLTDAQAGALLGCSASTVRSQAARALAKLRASGALADAGTEGTAPPRQAGGSR